MFRKPREEAPSDIKVPLTPSTGRPPTPPNAVNERRQLATPTMTTRTSSTKPLTPRPNSKTNVPVLGRQSNKKPVPTKGAGKPNRSILNFFRKVDNPHTDDGSLFMSQGDLAVESDAFGPRSPSPDIYGLDDDLHNRNNTDLEDRRYNEFGGSVKKRRLSSGTTASVAAEDSLNQTIAKSDSSSSKAATPHEAGGCSPPPPDVASTKPKSRRSGPFIDDSDSEDEVADTKNTEVGTGLNRRLQSAAVVAEEAEIGNTIDGQSAEMNYTVNTLPIHQDEIGQNFPVVPEVAAVLPVQGTDAMCDKLYDDATSGLPSLKKGESSFDEYDRFEDPEAFNEDDEFVDGEEFAEREWMEEQARLEEAEENTGTFSVENMAPTCPICEGNLGGLAENEASLHVNACLDGNPIPIPRPVEAEPEELKEPKMMPPGAVARFSRAAVPRPGQANPFEIGAAGVTPSSAFSKLMSSHAEDAAWVSAAAAENAARGKAAYQRTCPFYKIMPGFFICVDAFRYGAVQGCKAYFLSHFHSDHYIGLTSSWCHGPIYCSKVTANLVKQQLRVDPKWVVALDFESKFEVAGTEGVAVTMIPANHCPGSSLYLFEKVIGRGSNPKIQRVLHCGDFRACSAHVEHPLLKPEVLDAITGKTRQQKIDVCYLDTTYLNPKYAFPSQEDVIKSCADMCVSLSKDKADESDAWEVTKKERAGAGMAKFVGSAAKTDDSIAMEVGSNKTRGRLLVICGTYSIGKERICMGIARALNCKIWAPPGKQRIIAALEDPELSSRLTSDPREAQIHMQMLMEIRAETLQDYLNGFKPHFSRIVGFRPSGWNYRPPNSRFLESPSVHTVLTSDNWRSRYSMAELVPQRGSTREASCFGVPYSEHSSFRELTLFSCALRIEKIIPTVNVGSATSRAKMKTWIDRWMAERRKNGVVKIGHGEGEVRW